MKTLNYAVTVGLASLLSYWLTTTIMSSVHLSHEDGQLGGMCAVIATIFVLRRVGRRASMRRSPACRRRS
ncbi:hypothetical protein ACFVYV_46025 [Streptomyces mirabilis]|uniref:hypothetical protein n=1 Tax=Streptomyces mirabilis TaxID=68239 RepID=UPI0036DC49A0